MPQKIFVFDPTISDKQSAVRGVGRYLQILKENFPDWIFTNQLITNHYSLITTFINPFFNIISPPLTMRKIAQKQIAIIHDLIPLKYPNHFPIGIRGKINVWLNKLALKNYDLIVTDSQASKHDIIRLLKIQKNKIKVIYPCLPKQFTKHYLKTQNSNINPFGKLRITLNEIERVKSISESSNLKINKPMSKNSFDISDLTSNIGQFSIYVGDATWNKNLVNLAKAIKIANVTCIFVGKIFSQKVGVASEMALRKVNSWQYELNEFLTLTKDDKHFIFPGFIDDYKLFKLYEQAKVNILFSRDEGFGFSYVEAGNFNCPSILADIPVLKELAKDTTIFAHPNDPNDLANKIKEIYSNDQLRQELSIKAHQRSKKFSQENFKRKFNNILNH